MPSSGAPSSADVPCIRPTSGTLQQNIAVVK
jgi:hypothetical protein